MCKLIFTIILIFLSISLIGQQKSSLLGKWKVISYSSEGIYFNFKNDSFSIDTSIQSFPVDTSKLRQGIAVAKMVFGKIEWHFLNDGSFVQRMDTVLNITGQFKEIPSKNIIQLTSKNSLNNDVTEDVKYSIKNGLLYLTLFQEDEPMYLVLERISSQ